MPPSPDAEGRDAATVARVPSGSWTSCQPPSWTRRWWRWQSSTRFSRFVIATAFVVSYESGLTQSAGALTVQEVASGPARGYAKGEGRDREVPTLTTSS